MDMDMNMIDKELERLERDVEQHKIDLQKRMDDFEKDLQKHQDDWKAFEKRVGRVIDQRLSVVSYVLIEKLLGSLGQDKERKARKVAKVELLYVKITGNLTPQQQTALRGLRRSRALKGKAAYRNSSCDSVSWGEYLTVINTPPPEVPTPIITALKAFPNEVEALIQTKSRMVGRIVNGSIT